MEIEYVLPFLHEDVAAVFEEIRGKYDKTFIPLMTLENKPQLRICKDAFLEITAYMKEIDVLMWGDENEKRGKLVCAINKRLE